MNIGSTIPVSREPTVALALGGGGARGYAHIHVVEVLDELGIKPVAIAGTSMGSIIGAAYASGMTGAEIKQFALNTLGNKRSLLSKLWGQKTVNINGIMNPKFRFIHFDLENVLAKLMPSDLPSTFNDLQIPLHVLASDYHKFCDVIMNSGSLLSAIAASSSIPGVFDAVEREGMLLIDGVTTNPVPFEYLMSLADIVVAVDVTPDAELNLTVKGRPSSISTYQRSAQIMQRTMLNEKIARFQPHIVLKPELSGYKTSDFMKIEKILSDSAGIRQVAKDEIRKAFLNYHGEQADSSRLAII